MKRANLSDANTQEHLPSYSLAFNEIHLWIPDEQLFTNKSKAILVKQTIELLKNPKVICEITTQVSSQSD